MATNRSTRPPLTLTDALHELAAAGDVLGLARTAALDQGTRLAAAREQGLAREHARLVARYGPDHPRTQAIAARRDVQGRLVAAVAAERDRSATPVPAPRSDGAVVYGRVVDATGAPVARATVAASPPVASGGKTVHATTDADGRFELHVPVEKTASWSIHATASGSRRSPAMPAALAAGARAMREIRLDAGRAPSPGAASGDGDDDRDDQPRMPDVRGDTEAQARARLREAGLQNVSTRAAREDDTLGTVLRQEPPAGTWVKDDTAVVLDVVAAAAPDVSPEATVAVPSLAGMLLDEAAAALKEAGLAPGRIEGDRKAGRVVSQSPAAGARVQRAARVALTLRAG